MRIVFARQKTIEWCKTEANRCKTGADRGDVTRLLVELDRIQTEGDKTRAEEPDNRLLPRRPDHQMASRRENLFFGFEDEHTHWRAHTPRNLHSMEINILRRYLMGCEVPDGPKASVVLSSFMFFRYCQGCHLVIRRPANSIRKRR